MGEPGLSLLAYLIWNDVGVASEASTSGDVSTFKIENLKNLKYR